MENDSLHFVRTVEPRDQITAYMHNGFIEDTWFAKGFGLVRLEQRINGKISMTWTLKEFLSN